MGGRDGRSGEELAFQFLLVQAGSALFQTRDFGLVTGRFTRQMGQERRPGWMAVQALRGSQGLLLSAPALRPRGGPSLPAPGSPGPLPGRPSGALTAETLPAGWRRRGRPWKRGCARRRSFRARGTASAGSSSQRQAGAKDLGQAKQKRAGSTPPAPPGPPAVPEARGASASPARAAPWQLSRSPAGLAP